MTRHWSTVATAPHSTWAPGRAGCTVALAERGVPALGIDVTPYAVKIAQSSGALAILRDVFGRVPGAGRWMTILLADGNIGIGGDPAALLRRVGELLARGGHALVEVQPPGVPLRCENVRLRREGSAGAWFPWAYVGADQIGDVARSAGLILEETWTASGRWFAALACEAPAVPSLIPFARGAGPAWPTRPRRLRGQRRPGMSPPIWRPKGTACRLNDPLPHTGDGPVIRALMAA